MLPAVRLPSALSPTSDFQPSQKFELNWPKDPHASPAASRVAATDSDGDGSSSNPPTASNAASFPWDESGQEAEPDATPRTDDRDDGGGAHVPRLARAFSMPLPAQLGHLKHPVRYANSPLSAVDDDFKELAVELADSAQMVIQTLLQLSPPHLLDHAKEQFSGCAVQIPTPSLSALLTSMKNLNYVSANMPQLAPPAVSTPSMIPTTHATFDIGEMLQNVGDAHSGVAAQAGVDLVLYHADVGMKHISVVGDEGGLSYLLSYIVRQVLNVCRPGETIELGLQIVTAGAQTPLSTMDAPIDLASPENSPPIDVGGGLDISFEILHRLLPEASHEEPATVSSPVSEQQLVNGDGNASPTSQLGPSALPKEREQADFSGVLLERLLRRVGASLKLETSPSGSKKRLAVLSLVMQRGEALVEPHQLTAVEEAARQPFPDLNLAREPTLLELAQFTETLRGKKVVFHANSSGSFARHLSSYLTSWNMDVSHVPTDDTEEKVAGMAVPLDHSAAGSQRSDSYGQDGQPNPDTPRNMPAGPTFIVVDDDVMTLKRRILQLRAQAPYVAPKAKRQRPSLANYHRPRSSPAVRQYSSGLPQINEPDPLSQQVVFIHFTSLENYRYVKDMLQNTLGTSAGNAMPLPEIIVVPKPAGPRRFLTALYTAVHKPVVDPFFLPIATSPMSPGTSTFTPFFSATSASHSRSLRNRQGSAASAGSGNSTTERERRSPRVGGDVSLQPTTPLAMDGIEYFSETAAKKVGSTPATGVVIQSPDGRPAGIFFQPTPRQSRIHHGGRINALAVPRVPSGRVRRSPEDTPDGVRAIVDLADSSQVSQIALEPAKAERKTSSRATRPFAYDVAGDSGTSGEESGSGQPSVPRFPARPSSPASAAQVARRASSSFSITRAPHATPSGMQASADDSTIRSGRSTSARQTNGVHPSSSMGAADATQGVGRGGRASGATSTESPTVSKSQPLNSSGPTPSTSSSAQARKASRKQTEPVPPGQDLVAESATPARLVDRARKTRTVWKGQDIVPPINVLIVEDNMINRTILSTSLKKMGVKYGQASNGQEAIEKWRKGNYHLILMDIHMPVMDGIAATREIRRLEGGPRPFPSPSIAVLEPAVTLQPPDQQSPFRSSVIVVALTASNLDSDRIAALAAGCNDYITKPVSLEWLRQKIMEWGSIKALQMWAEIPAKFDAQLDRKALDIASHLKLPQSREVSPDKPGPSRSRFIDERSVSPIKQPPSPRPSNASTRSISPSPTRHIPPASASEESIATPPTPEDDGRDNPTVLVTAPDRPLLSDGDVRNPLPADAVIPLGKSSDATTPSIELPGALSPAELEVLSCTDLAATPSARK